MPLASPNFVASGNITTASFVKISGNATVAQAGDNDPPVGVSQTGTRFPPMSDLTIAAQAAQAGEGLKVYGEGDQALVRVGSGQSVTAGQYLKADSSGDAVPVATTGTTVQNYGAQALEGGSAGNLIRVQVIRGFIRPALT